MDTGIYRVKPGEKRIDLGAWDTDDDGGLARDVADVESLKLTERIAQLQERLYAEGKRSVLVVLQAMDGAGKDSTIKSVFGPLNPQGLSLTSFKAPCGHERAHDFLWRVHAHTPSRGYIGLFNRSHYEDVLVVRVKNLVQESIWKKRYKHIVNFEELLVDEGTAVVKFYLHVSRDYQRERLQKRLDDPAKHWKFEPNDLTERALWKDYREAFEVAVAKTSTKDAPWYIIPAEKRWFRNWLVAKIMVETLESMDIQLPKPDFDPKSIVIK
ncbi:MAG: polyphosphate kinase 2 family protein [Planctomycetota bacterium]|nr:polyphosphate kinase 2 family protein [Planctomycetota bacterium]MDA1106763.1 polyphosphate kinase 2 family protein [Planctomycetota bacterium]